LIVNYPPATSCNKIKGIPQPQQTSFGVLLQPTSTCSSTNSIAIGVGVGGGFLLLAIIIGIIVAIVYLKYKKKDGTVTFGSEMTTSSRDRGASIGSPRET